MSNHACHVCGALEPKEFAAFPLFCRVTSDNKPWNLGGRLAWCSACDCAQAVLDNAWHEQAATIYGSYELHRSSQGHEQIVFDAITGQAMARSDQVLQKLARSTPVPAKGRLLDIGCGTGAFLTAFAKANPAWQLFGHDINERFRKVVESIPHVERLFACPLEEVPGKYQFISLIHSFEHIPHPAEFLGRVWSLLDEGGLLLIQVPDCEVSHFVYLIADHASHFFLAPMKELVASVGYEPVIAINNWVPKEISLVARKTTSVAKRRPIRAMTSSFATITKQMKWLQDQAASIKQLQTRASVGVFGATFAATWVYGELAGKAAFFVDEDPHKVGQNHLGKQIISPQDVPAGSTIYMPFPRKLAQAIVSRIANPRVQWQVPPDLGN